jgi:hypothetical protein
VDVATIVVESWRAFNEFVLQQESGWWIYRGQKSDWPLKTTLERAIAHWAVDFSNAPGIETHTIRDFKRKYRGPMRAPLSLRRTSIRYLVEFEDAVIRKAIGELLGSARRVSVRNPMTRRNGEHVHDWTAVRFRDTNSIFRANDRSIRICWHAAIDPSIGWSSRGARLSALKWEQN